MIVEEIQNKLADLKDRFEKIRLENVLHRQVFDSRCSLNYEFEERQDKTE